MSQPERGDQPRRGRGLGRGARSSTPGVQRPATTTAISPCCAVLEISIEPLHAVLQLALQVLKHIPGLFFSITADPICRCGRTPVVWPPTQPQFIFVRPWRCWGSQFEPLAWPCRLCCSLFCSACKQGARRNRHAFSRHSCSCKHAIFENSSHAAGAFAQTGRQADRVGVGVAAAQGAVDPAGAQV